MASEIPLIPVFTSEDVDELIELRNKAILGDKTSADRYKTLAHKFSTFKGIDYTYLLYFLEDPNIPIPDFRFGVGYPELPMYRLLDQYQTEEIRSRTLSIRSAQNEKSVLRHFIYWLEKVNIHPNDINVAIFNRFIEDENLQARYPAARVKHFWKWLESNRYIKPIDSTIRYLNPGKGEKPINYYRVFIKTRPEIPKSQVGIREFPKEGWVKITKNFFVHPTGRSITTQALQDLSQYGIRGEGTLSIQGENKSGVWLERSPDSETIDKNKLVLYVVGEDKWFYSDVNLIYNVIFENSELFDDWRRLEILIRILRESGLRWVHWHHLMWSDIDYDSVTPKIIYDRMKTATDEKGEPIVKQGKGVPTKNTPISPLLSRRIRDYRTKWGPAEPENSYICQFKLSTGQALRPRMEYHDFTRARSMDYIFTRIRHLGGFQYCQPPIKTGYEVKVAGEWYWVVAQDHPKHIFIQDGTVKRPVTYSEVEDVIKHEYKWPGEEGAVASTVSAEDETVVEFGEIERVGDRLYLPERNVMPFCPYMFRYSYGTLIGNVLDDTETMGAYFGDNPETLKKHYRASGLRDYYKEECGISDYQDILTEIFSNEGLYKGELPSGRLKRGRKRKGFQVQSITPFSDSKLWK